jgi:hypothetical protein
MPSIAALSVLRLRMQRGSIGQRRTMSNSWRMWTPSSAPPLATAREAGEPDIGNAARCGAGEKGFRSAVLPRHLA